MQYNICYLCKLIQRSQTDSKKKKNSQHVCLCAYVGVCMWICLYVFCVSLHVFCIFFVVPL